MMIRPLLPLLMLAVLLPARAETLPETPAAPYASLGLNVNLQDAQSNTNCTPERCIVHRTTTEDIMAGALRRAGLFERVETAVKETVYRLQVDFQHEFRAQGGGNVLAGVLAASRGKPQPVYQRSFDARFHLQQGSGTVADYRYQLSRDTHDPLYLNHFAAHDHAAEELVAQFIADLKSRPPAPAGGGSIVRESVEPR